MSDHLDARTLAAMFPPPAPIRRHGLDADDPSPRAPVDPAVAGFGPDDVDAAMDVLSDLDADAVAERVEREQAEVASAEEERARAEREKDDHVLPADYVHASLPPEVGAPAVAEPEAGPMVVDDVDDGAEPGYETIPDTERNPIAPVAVPEAGAHRKARLPRQAPSRKTIITAAAVAVAVALVVALVVVLATRGNDDAEVTAAPAAAPAAPAAETVAPVVADGTHFGWFGDRLSRQALTFPNVVLGTSGSTYDLHIAADTTAGQTIDEIGAAALTGDLPDVVVFAYGTIDDVDQTDIDTLVSVTAGAGTPLVLVGPGAADPTDLPWAEGVNARYQAAASTPGVYFVNWQAVIDDNPSAVEQEQGRSMVLTAPGASAWANAVNLTLKNIFDATTPAAGS